MMSVARSGKGPKALVRHALVGVTAASLFVGYHAAEGNEEPSSPSEHVGRHGIEQTKGLLGMVSALGIPEAEAQCYQTQANSCGCHCISGGIYGSCIELGSCPEIECFHPDPCLCCKR